MEGGQRCCVRELEWSLLLRGNSEYERQDDGRHEDGTRFIH
jgi:hypothetical protein